MGLSEAEFWDMTPRYFAALRKAEIEKEQKQWERARYIGYLSMLPHVNPKKRLKITDLGRFPWEKQETVFEPVDPEEMKRVNERHRKLLEARRKERIANGTRRP